MEIVKGLGQKKEKKGGWGIGGGRLSRAELRGERGLGWAGVFIRSG